MMSVIVRVLSGLVTSENTAGFNRITGAIAIAVLMVVATVGLFVVYMMPCLFTTLYGTYSNGFAGAITVAAFMVVATVGLFVVYVISCLGTACDLALITDGVCRCRC